MTKTPEIHLIVAIADDGAIGLRGDMPWGRTLPRDLKHFKEVTMGMPIIMGRKTFESFPKGPLPGRLNIVISRRQDYAPEGVQVVHSWQEALAAAGAAECVFVIGGGMLYTDVLPFADVLHITRVHHSWPEADTYFPPIDFSQWQCVSHEDHEPGEDNKYPISFTRWHRTKRKE